MRREIVGGLTLALVLVMTMTMVAPFSVAAIAGIVASRQHTWRYNEGFLQGASNVGLNTTHTNEFLLGYSKGTQQYWYNKGYVESNNKIPMSSDDVNYTKGHTDANYDLVNFGHIGSLPAHTSDNYRKFYLGLQQGAFKASVVNVPGGENITQSDACPPGSTAEYCAGWKFGIQWGYDALGPAVYDAGYLQGTEGVKLKGTHTQAFLSGYAKGIKEYLTPRTQGFLQGVSGVQLKGTHTQEFMSGYMNGTELYWYYRGYAEGNNKLPMSSQNANYTEGYTVRGGEC
jgi:hypothetical protein